MSRYEDYEVGEVKNLLQGFYYKRDLIRDKLDVCLRRSTRKKLERQLAEINRNINLCKREILRLEREFEPTSPTESLGFKGDREILVESKNYRQDKFWAFLVGINKYLDPFISPLIVCVDDVTAIQQTLVGCYQVTKLLTDATPEHLPTRANILGELATVAESAAEEDLLLFYFSGHGIAEGGESYLLARDTRLSALKYTAVAMADVREFMARSPAHAKVIVIDACHSGASIGKAEPLMTPEFIRHVFEQAEGMAVLASCKQGQRSWQWPEQGRSVFTYYLLDALTGKADFDDKGFVTIHDANRYVTDGVKTWAAEKGMPQTPTLQYTGAGDIILLRYSGG